MIRDLGDRVEISGAMTMATATGLLADGTALLLRADTAFDLGGVTDVDSAGLAVIFGLQRAAKLADRKLRIVNMPHNLQSLADVYGVSELLPF